MISRPLYHRGTSKNLNRISQVENNDGQKNNVGQIEPKKKNAKNVICGIFQNSNWGWESGTDKAESAAGLSFKKKNWNLAQWQMKNPATMAVAAPTAIGF